MLSYKFYSVARLTKSWIQMVSFTYWVVKWRDVALSFSHNLEEAVFTSVTPSRCNYLTLVVIHILSLRYFKKLLDMIPHLVLVVGTVNPTLHWRHGVQLHHNPSENAFQIRFGFESRKEIHWRWAISTAKLLISWPYFWLLLLPAG